MNTFPARRASLPRLAAVVLPFALLGCASTSPPPPQKRPAPESASAYPATSRSVQVTTDALQRFADEAARELAVKLPQAVAHEPTKVVLTFAPMSNASTLTDANVAYLAEALRSSMVRAESVRGSFIIIDGSYASATEALQNFQPAGTTAMHDPTNAASGSRPAAYDPNQVYFLSLAADEAAGGNDRALALTVDLRHPMSRRTLLSQRLTTTLRYDATTARWVVQSN